LLLNNNDVYDVKTLYFLGGNISTGSTYMDIHGNGVGSYLSLIQGTSYISFDTSLNLSIVAPNITNTTSANYVVNATGVANITASYITLASTVGAYVNFTGGDVYVSSGALRITGTNTIFDMWNYTSIAQNSGVMTITMGNGYINNVNAINFNTTGGTANIDGVYPNQLNFNAANSYFLGNLRLYGSGLVFDMALNDITNVQNQSFTSGGAITNLATLTMSASGTIDVTQGVVYNATQVYNQYGGIVVGGADGSIKRFQNGTGNSYLEINATEQVTLKSTQNVTISCPTVGKFLTLTSDAIFMTTPTVGGHDININSGRDAFLTGLRDITLYAPTAGANITLDAPTGAGGIVLTANTNITTVSQYFNHTGTNITFTETTSFLVTAPTIMLRTSATGFIKIDQALGGYGKLAVGVAYSVGNQLLYGTSATTTTPTAPILQSIASQDAIYTDAAGQGSVTTTMPYAMGAGTSYQVCVTEKSTSIVTAPTVWSQYPVNSTQITVFVSSPTRPFTNILFSYIAVGPFS
jgi:hypothetical protein